MQRFRNIFGAPLAIIICYDDILSWKNGRNNGHDSGEVDAFGIPANEHPVAILALGYPAEGCKPSDKHAAYRGDEEMIRFK